MADPVADFIQEWADELEATQSRCSHSVVHDLHRLADVDLWEETCSLCGLVIRRESDLY